MLQVLARVQTSLQLPSRERRQDGKKSSRCVSRVSASCVCVCVCVCVGVCVWVGVCVCVCVICCHQLRNLSVTSALCAHLLSHSLVTRCRDLGCTDVGCRDLGCR